jgi:hypothetical protein
MKRSINMKKLVTILLLCCVAFLLVSQVRVKGYYRKDGTYVQPHVRSNPDGNPYNNYSTKGNVNPYTGKEGTKKVSGTSSSAYTYGGSSGYGISSTATSSKTGSKASSYAPAHGGEKYDIECFYRSISVDYGTKAIDDYGEIIEIDKILKRDNSIKNGQYSVTLSSTRDNDIYEIDGTDYYVELSLCYEYAIRDEAILTVKSYGSTKYGEVVFLDQ